MLLIKNYFKARPIGFYISFAAAVLTVLTAIIYGATFAHNDNAYIVLHPEVLVLLISGGVVYFALSLTTFTTDYAPLALFGLQFAAFLAFMSKSYMYFTEVFFSATDFSTALSAMSTMHFGFGFTTFVLVIVGILTIVTSFMKQYKKIDEIRVIAL